MATPLPAKERDRIIREKMTLIEKMSDHASNREKLKTLFEKFDQLPDISDQTASCITRCQKVC
ncbi:hypothetical protein [Magnetococcus sp. PR-3]|uniref:hypothetical protein n=1 Tax=Magnetococcus sp. PR-3 TaxID=3120355 RepID=UPI002FCE3930